MNLNDVLDAAKKLGPLLQPEALKLEEEGIAELRKLAEQISSPDLKLVVESFIAALDEVAKAEIAKLDPSEVVAP